MNKEYLFAPQWQDSGITNELYSGAIALRDYFKSISSIEIKEIVVDPNNEPVLENDIYGFTIILNQLLKIESILNGSQPDKVMTLGGGCGIEIPIVSYLSGKYHDLHVFWFDAHGDLNSPETSPSKYFHGMPLRFLTERQNDEIGKRYNILPTRNVHLIGTRDLDKPEAEYIKKNQIEVVEINSGYWNRIGEQIYNHKPSFIHIDLDVIDPKEYRNVKCPVKNGIKIEELVKTIKHIIQSMKVVGISIVENIEKDRERIKLLSELFEEAIRF